ncbi:MAG: DUF1501 domain-containing protein [Planctomycetes bacterium]|nr:DUF1501 domain-containing protein [Planctomycetota bacterium]
MLKRREEGKGVIHFVTDRQGPGGSITRREWLRLGGLGLAASPAAATSASKASGFGRAKSVLLLYASGGQSQIDTWDMKPDAPEEIRGAFRPIATSVPGIRVCEHMPKLARLAHLYTIVRSLAHDDLDHGSATYLALTGQFHPQKTSNPPPRPTDFPTYGAVLHRVRPSRRWPYSAVYVNGPALVPEVPGPGQFGGFLGRAYDPLWIGDASEALVPFAGLDTRHDLSAGRLAGRRSLLQSVERARRHLEDNPALVEMSASYRHAYDLLAAPHVRQAFDLGQEPAALRDRYGRHRTGQACLLARRLVEAGVPFVTVVWCLSNRGQDKAPGQTDAYGWDTHNDIFESLQHHLLPRFDQTFATLLMDLKQRGLLESTLVVCMGEFGRAPLVALERTFAGTSPGRKHWAGAYSIVVAGAGVACGGLVGASDRHGAYVKGPSLGPGDVAATMFHALGVDPSGHYTDPTGRPFPLATGNPIADLYKG